MKCKIANNKIKCNNMTKWSIWLQNIPKVWLLLTKWSTKYDDSFCWFFIQQLIGLLFTLLKFKHLLSLLFNIHCEWVISLTGGGYIFSIFVVFIVSLALKWMLLHSTHNFIPKYIVTGERSYNTSTLTPQLRDCLSLSWDRGCYILSQNC